MGEPEPKGNMKGFPRGRHVIITDGNKNLKGWEQAVRYEAQRYVEEHGLSCADAKTTAVVLHVEFSFQKPKSTAKSIVVKTTRPDLDKLIRAIGDALKGIIYDDDGQINMIVAEKKFAQPGQQAGVLIRFWVKPIRETR
jgi:Holliday junction resolvase RusA-like endonuclease